MNESKKIRNWFNKYSESEPYGMMDQVLAEKDLVRNIKSKNLDVWEHFHDPLEFMDIMERVLSGVLGIIDECEHESCFM